MKPPDSSLGPLIRQALLEHNVRPEHADEFVYGKIGILPDPKLDPDVVVAAFDATVSSVPGFMGYKALPEHPNVVLIIAKTQEAYDEIVRAVHARFDPD